MSMLIGAAIIIGLALMGLGMIWYGKLPSDHEQSSWAHVCAVSTVYVGGFLLVAGIVGAPILDYFQLWE